uniref:Uncharacterized protein n=1 Tax=Opuntia streptacantha TaxID=393608 RepID=A0A7C8YFD7_OPUST
MASMCVSASTAVVALWAPPLHTPSPSPPSSSSCLSSLSNSSFRCSLSPKGLLIPALRCGGVRRSHVVRMAPEEERITRRSPLDFPIEWERARPARRPDIFPKFSPMKTPLPIPMPTDPPLEDEEEYEEQFEKPDEERENPDEEDGDSPGNQQ